MFSQKVNFDASLLVVQFYCQLEVRYHVTRAQAETCYGCLRCGIKIQKEVCLLRRSGNIQDRYWLGAAAVFLIEVHRTETNRMHPLVNIKFNSSPIRNHPYVTSFFFCFESIHSSIFYSEGCRNHLKTYIYGPFRVTFFETNHFWDPSLNLLKRKICSFLLHWYLVVVGCKSSVHLLYDWWAKADGRGRQNMVWETPGPLGTLCTSLRY